jgi:ribosomal protein S27AE
MEGTEGALYEEHERLQQEELDTAIETYESMSQQASICIKCQHYTFAHYDNIHQCATCGFTMKKEVTSLPQTLMLAI